MISLGRTAGVRFPDVALRMLSEVGDDHVADIVVSFMKGNNVDPSLITRRKGSQSHISLAFLDSENNASYEFYKDHAHTLLDPSSVKDTSFNRDDLVLFGSYFAVNPAIRENTRHLLELAHRSGAILYYDINFRKAHIGEIPVILPSIEENCRLSDFVRGSSEDFLYLWGTSDPEQVYREYISPLCPNFICTCGPEPLHIFSGNGMHLTFDVQKIQTVSTIGAGDNFNAGFLYGLLSRERAKEDCDKLSEDDWRDLVRVASRFSGNVCRSIYNYVEGGPEALGL